MKFVYQIYPLSFKDSNNDGIGDLQGIISKLDYIKSIGVEYVWITPFYKSPMNDNGYDVADYYDVNEIFGTKEDLETLINEAKKRGLKIMLDLVLNHTSTQHPWFKSFINGEKGYEDFYIWKKSDKVPNNWKSKFGGSCWEEYKKGYWYLHLFDKTQADLNWDNPLVRTKIMEVVKYYINLGVRGFRFDVINLISKSTFEDDFEGDGRRFYTNGPRVHEYVKEIASNFPSDVDFLTVGELSSTDFENAKQFSNPNENELSSVFTFHHLKVDYPDKLNKFVYGEPSIKELYDISKLWYSKMCETNSVMANFLNNHDQPRSVSRFIDKEYRNVGAKMLFVGTSCLPGINYIYQGEEIAMTNANFKTKDQYRDIETLNYFEENNLSVADKGVLTKSRDNSRTPMQWNDEQYSGFSNAKPWIDVISNYKEINVENEDKDANSVLNFYRKHIEFLKDNEVFKNGSVVFNDYNDDNIISYTRQYKNKSYTVVCSYNNENKYYEFNINQVVSSNYDTFEENLLKPYQYLIIKN